MSSNAPSMVPPINKIVLDSIGIHVQTLRIQTETMMHAGRLVKKGTDDHEIVVNTSGAAAIGWLGYEQTTKKHRPATVDTIYEISGQAAVVWGPGIIINAQLLSGCTVAKGAVLYPADNGRVQTSVWGTVVAKAEESTSGAATDHIDILVRSLI